MPFDFTAYKQKCKSLSIEELQLEWNKYTREKSGGATATTISILFAPITAGVSLIALGLSSPQIHNARKKIEIINAELLSRKSKPRTFLRDIAGPVFLSWTIGMLSVGLADPVAQLLGAGFGEKGVEYVAAKTALHGAGALVEHKIGEDVHHKAERNYLKAGHEHLIAEHEHLEESVQVCACGLKHIKICIILMMLLVLWLVRIDSHCAGRDE